MTADKRAALKSVYDEMFNNRKNDFIMNSDLNNFMMFLINEDILLLNSANKDLLFINKDAIIKSLKKKF